MVTPETLVSSVFNVEGGYVNDPKDAGGETNHGITVEVARANGYTGPMKDLTTTQAREIYLRQYFEKPNFDAVFDVSPGIAAELFDTGVNMGPKVASVFLQRCLNALNREAQDYSDIPPDGDIGPTTINALRAFLKKRGLEGEHRLLKALNALQGERYIKLAETRPGNEKFLYGWLDRVTF